MYFEIETKNIVTRSFIKEKFRETSLPPEPFDLEDLGYFFINIDPRPTGDVVEFGEIVVRESKYYQTWVVRSFNEEELLLKLNAKKQKLSEKVKSLTRRLLEKGVEYTFKDQGTFRIQLRDGDRANLVSLRVLADANSFTSQVYRTYENLNILLENAEDVKNLTNFALASYNNILNKSWSLKDSIKSSLTEEDLDLVWENRDIIFKE